MSATNQGQLNVKVGVVVVVVLEAEAFFLLCKYNLLHVNVTSLTWSGMAQEGGGGGELPCEGL